MRTGRYQHLRDGDVIELKYNKNGFMQRVMCCDCGLIHTFYFRFTKPGKLEFTAVRDEKATRATRARRVRPFVARCRNGVCPVEVSQADTHRPRAHTQPRASTPR